MNLSSIINKYKIKMAIMLFILLYLIIYLSKSIFVVIPPGSAGVLFSLLSQKSLSEAIHPEGLYVLSPWNKMLVYDVSMQKKTLDTRALTLNGLSINIRISTIFSPIPDKLSELVIKLGPTYAEKVLEPIIHSSVREVIGSYRPELLYTTATTEIQHAIHLEAEKELKDMPIDISSIIIENIELPKSINAAIETKLRFQQETLEYEFRLEREKREAARRKIEALGIKEAQNVIASSLSEDLLLWLGIKATSEIARSSNSKVIMIGGGKHGLPIILNAEKSDANTKEDVEININDVNTEIEVE